MLDWCYMPQGTLLASRLILVISGEFVLNSCLVYNDWSRFYVLLIATRTELLLINTNESVALLYSTKFSKYLARNFRLKHSSSFCCQFSLYFNYFVTVHAFDRCCSCFSFFVTVLFHRYASFMISCVGRTTIYLLGRRHLYFVCGKHCPTANRVFKMIDCSRHDVTRIYNMLPSREWKYICIANRITDCF